jgi:chromosome segregation ATPase
MMRSLLRVALVAVGLVAGILAGFGYEHYQLEKQSKSYQDKLNESNKKFAIIQKKYTDERALGSSLERQKKSALEETAKIRKDNEELAQTIEKLKADVLSSEGQNKAAAEKLSLFRSELDEAARRLNEAARAVSERDTAIKRLSAEQQALQANLKKNQEGLERCEGNNARLCIIARDILGKYENKGVLTAISHSEPLTQLKKVELEKYVQEYSQLIDQEKVKKQDK